MESSHLSIPSMSSNLALWIVVPSLMCGDSLKCSTYARRYSDTSRADAYVDESTLKMAHELQGPEAAGEHDLPLG